MHGGGSVVLALVRVGGLLPYLLRVSLVSLTLFMIHPMRGWGSFEVLVATRKHMQLSVERCVLSCWFFVGLSRGGGDTENYSPLFLGVSFLVGYGSLVMIMSRGICIS